MRRTKFSGADMMRRNSGAGQAYARMMRSGKFNPAIVYVEGTTDIHFYKWMVDRSNVTLEQMEGKDAAMDAVAKANQKKTKGVLAIVDSDFDHLLHIGPDTNVVRTDTHDIETLMISEGAFNYVQERYIDEIKIEKTGYTVDSVWNKIIEIATEIGKVRLISKENNYNLNFSYVENLIEKNRLIKIEKNQIGFDVRQYIWECVDATNKCSVNFNTVYAKYKEDNRSFDTWQICRGHDLTLILSIIYSKDILGRRNVYRDEIETLISSTYIASRKFKKSLMFNEIKEWQFQNKGWKILSDELV